LRSGAILSNRAENEEGAAVRAVVHFGQRRDGSSPEGYKESYNLETCSELAADLGGYLITEFAAAGWNVQVSWDGNKVRILHPVGSDLETESYLKTYSS
jgi:hypothetical protein